MAPTLIGECSHNIYDDGKFLDYIAEARDLFKDPDRCFYNKRITRKEKLGDEEMIDVNLTNGNSTIKVRTTAHDVYVKAVRGQKTKRWLKFVGSELDFTLEDDENCVTLPFNENYNSMGGLSTLTFSIAAVSSAIDALDKGDITGDLGKSLTIICVYVSECIRSGRLALRINNCLREWEEYENFGYQWTDHIHDWSKHCKLLQDELSRTDVDAKNGSPPQYENDAGGSIEGVKPLPAYISKEAQGYLDDLAIVLSSVVVAQEYPKDKKGKGSASGSGGGGGGGSSGSGSSSRSSDQGGARSRKEVGQDGSGSSQQQEKSTKGRGTTSGGRQRGVTVLQEQFDAQLSSPVSRGLPNGSLAAIADGANKLPMLVPHVERFLERANNGRSRSSRRLGRSPKHYNFSPRNSLHVVGQTQGCRVYLKPEEKSKISSVVLKLRGIDEDIAATLAMEMAEDSAQVAKLRSALELVDHKRRKIKDLLLASGKSSSKVCMGLPDSFIEHACEKVDNPVEFSRVLKKALQARGTDASKFNVSHLFVTIHIYFDNLITGENLYNKLSMVDLAGSESLTPNTESGKHVTELIHIMQSLSALGDVLSSLTLKMKKDDIPYENSLLTKLLADSLGGSAKTLMIVNICQDVSSLPETLSSLNFSSRARSAALSLGNRDTIKKWRDVANDARKELFEKEKEIHDLKQEVLGLKQAVKDANDQCVLLLYEVQNAWKVSFTSQSDLKSENKHKIEKEHNSQLRNQIAQLLQVEQEQKLQIQERASTIQILQAKIKNFELQVSEALQSAESRSGSAIESNSKVEGDSADSSAVTKKLEEELVKRDVLIEILQQMKRDAGPLALEGGGSPIPNPSTAAEDSRPASLISLDGIPKQIKDITMQSSGNSPSRSKKRKVLASLDELAEQMPSLFDIDHPCAKRQRQIVDACSLVEASERLSHKRQQIQLKSPPTYPLTNIIPSMASTGSEYGKQFMNSEHWNAKVY